MIIRRLVLSSFSDVCLFILSRVVSSLKNPLKNQAEVPSIQDTKAAEIPAGSSESGQDYAAVESVKAVGSQLPLLGNRPNRQEIYHFLLSPTD